MFRLLSALIVLCPFSLVLAQSESLRPGINDSYQNPVVNDFVERFEKEGREVYDHRAKIIESTAVKPDMVIADIGAGTGLFTRLLAQETGAQGTVIAVDIAREFVDHVIRTSREAGLQNVQGKVCAQDSVELPEESIDLAFICDTYHHFEYPYKTMRSVWRALKPNGRIVLVEFHRDEKSSSEWILGHLRAGQAVFVEEIKRSGFKEVSQADFMKTSYLMTFEKTDATTPAGHTEDTLEDVQAVLKDQTAIFLDVRERTEWEQGHLASARFFPLSDITHREQSGTLEPLNLARNQIIYTYCRSGNRSVKAANILKNQGYDARALKPGLQELSEFGFEAAK